MSAIENWYPGITWKPKPDENIMRKKNIRPISFNDINSIVDKI